jgi:hypothetical protein
LSRYYDIALFPLVNGVPAATSVRRWTSHPGGTKDPGALNIQMDVPEYSYDTPMGAGTITIEGVPLADMEQAQQFASPIAGEGMYIVVRGGMQAGLPLANPAQAGVISEGQIWQSWGNWQGTEMSLNFQFNISALSYNRPGNIVLDWRAGTPLASALTTTLTNAYPGKVVQVNISPNLILPHDEVGHYHTLEQLAQTVKDITKGMIGTGYPGVYITARTGKIVAFDTTIKQPPKSLLFNDFIGQPVWVKPRQMQLKVVMRADLKIGAYVTMPASLAGQPGAVLTTAASLPSLVRNKSIFQGEFLVTAIRHIGDFRSDNSAEWVSILDLEAMRVL